MDQEEFEDSASAGERPIGGWRDQPDAQHVAIPAAEDSDYRDDDTVDFKLNPYTGNIFIGNSPGTSGGVGFFYSGDSIPRDNISRNRFRDVAYDHEADC